MSKLTEKELIDRLNAMEKDAVKYNGEFMAVNEELLSEYLGMLYGDEIEGQSQAISTDIQDVVEADMPSLARIFLGANDILEFTSNTDDPAEIAEAEEKTKYINWLVRKQPNSFKTLHDWMKDAEIQKFGVVKYYVETVKKPEEMVYRGLSADELTQLKQSLEADKGVDSVKIVSRDITNDGIDDVFDVTFRVTRECQKIVVQNVPVEDFLITRNCRTPQEAELLGDICIKTRGELIAEGFDKEKVALLPAKGRESEGQLMKDIRFDDQGGFVELTGKERQEKVEIRNLYPLIDADGDGIAERRNIIKSGNIILQNEPYGRAPYALLSAILMPHSAIGRSRAEITKPTQYIKTHLLRGMLNNTYQVNKPGWAIDDSAGGGVEMDDLLTQRLDRIVRVQGNPNEKLMPLVTPYIGDKSLQVIQYMDNARAQSTGTLQASQGLDADALEKETATRFEGVQDASIAKIELVARVFAETGYRDLFDGLCWLVQHYQDEATEIKVLGKALRVDPASWQYDHACSSNVGLGAGDDEKIMQNMGGLLQISAQLAERQSPLTDAKKVYNILNKLVKGMGLPRVGDYFNDPEVPEQVLMAQNEQLKGMVQQLQAQLQNPLAEAEKIKAQAQLVVQSDKHERALQVSDMAHQSKLELEDSKKQTEMGKFYLQQAAEQENFRREMAQKQDEFMKDYVLKLTELELKYKQGSQPQTEDIPGSLV